MAGVNWDDLRYFRIAVQQGTLSAAAETLGVNRTTVSRRIQALERQLGMPLLEHLQHGYQPNSAGDKVLQTVRHIEHLVFQLEQDLGREELHLEGTLRVAAPLGLGPEFMQDFAAFSLAFPKINLELINTMNPLDSLTQRSADVALAVTNFCPDSVQGQCLATLERGVYASKSYLQRHSPEDPLSEQIWVGWGKEMADTLAARWMQRNLSAQTRISTRVNSWHAMKEAVCSGLGVGQLWCFFAEGRSDLVALTPAAPELSMGLWLFQHTDCSPSLRVKRFSEFMAARIQEKTDHC